MGGGGDGGESSKQKEVAKGCSFVLRVGRHHTKSQINITINLEIWQSYLELVYLVTALVPSDTACLANSPGSSRRTAVWISLEVMVERLL